MKETTKESPIDRGQVELTGRCQVCGAEGPIFVVPGAPPPSELCARCAIEYGEGPGIEEEGQ